MGRRGRRTRADFLIPQMRLSHEPIISFELCSSLPHKSCSYCSTNLLPMRQTCQHNRAWRLKIYLKVPRSTLKCLEVPQSTMKYLNVKDALLFHKPLAISHFRLTKDKPSCVLKGQGTTCYSFVRTSCKKTFSLVSLGRSKKCVFSLTPTHIPLNNKVCLFIFII